jgi:hypothetical protein
LANTTPDLPAVTVMSAIKQALDTWASVTRLKFTEAQVPSGAEIVVSFQSGDHGDGNPFDGAGGTLAHAYYPTVPPTPIAGDTHFDEAETWSLSVPPSTGAFDLLTVAIHEFGHALGLDHSKDPGATMFATYAGLRRGLALDDIQRIQKLYGASATPPPLPPTPVARAPHLNLGILLGTLQQGLRVPRRLNPMMAGDLQGISSEAPKGGYVQFEGYVQQASGLLQQRDYLAMAQSVALLMVLLQGQVVGPQRLVQASALSLGISLGWLQQGAAAGSRLVPETVEGLNYVRLHAPNAGFTGYEPSVSSALQMLQSTQDVRRILPIVTQLITFLQNQSLT